MEGLRIVFLVEAGKGGGSTNAAISMCEGFHDNGFESMLFYIEPTIRNVLRVIRAVNPNYVVTSSTLMHRAAALACCGRRPTHIWWQKTMIPQSRKDDLYRKLSKVITVSKAASKGYGYAHAYNAIPDTRIGSCAFTPNLKHSTINGHILGFVGSLSNRKRPDIALRTFRYLNVVDPDKYELVIAGDEVDFTVNDLKGVYDHDNIHYVQKDFFASRNVIPYCNLILHPSHEDAYGLVIMEAARWGIPVLATAGSGGPDELLHHLGKPEFLVKPDCVEQWGNMVDRYVGTKPLYKPKFLEMSQPKNAARDFLRAILSSNKHGYPLMDLEGVDTNGI